MAKFNEIWLVWLDRSGGSEDWGVDLRGVYDNAESAKQHKQILGKKHGFDNVSVSREWVESKVHESVLSATKLI